LILGCTEIVVKWLFTASAGVNWRGGVTVKVIITRASQLSDKHSTVLL